MIGASSESAFTGPLSMLRQMELGGLTLEPKCEDVKEKETPRYTGGYITAQYGSGQLNFMDAIQLEFGETSRSKSEIPITAKKVAAAIKSQYDNFLQPKR
jgi:hypothetical protein